MLTVNSMSPYVEKGIESKDVVFDNTSSSLEATNVQSAIDEVVALKDASFTLASNMTTKFSVSSQIIKIQGNTMTGCVTLQTKTAISSGEFIVGSINIKPLANWRSILVCANPTNSTILGYGSFTGNGNVYINISAASGVYVSFSFSAII